MYVMHTAVDSLTFSSILYVTVTGVVDIMNRKSALYIHCITWATNFTTLLHFLLWLQYATFSLWIQIDASNRLHCSQCGSASTSFCELSCDICAAAQRRHTGIVQGSDFKHWKYAVEWKELHVSISKFPGQPEPHILPCKSKVISYAFQQNEIWLTTQSSRSSHGRSKVSLGREAIR